MRILITILIMVAVVIVNGRRFDGPLNLKEINATTFNVEDSAKLIVGTGNGNIYVSQFQKNSLIVNFKPTKKHYGSILGIKRLEPTGQYITVGSNGRVVKWHTTFSKVTAQQKYLLQQNNIKSVAFVSNKANMKENRKLAFSNDDTIYILATKDLKELKNFTAASLNLTTIQKIAFLNGILVVYGHAQSPAVVQINENYQAKQIYKDHQNYLSLMSQFTSNRDNPTADGFVVSSTNNLYYINLEGKGKVQQAKRVLAAPLQVKPSSLNYCGRTGFNQTLAKQTGRIWEGIILIGYKTHFDIYRQVFSQTTKESTYVKGQTYTLASSNQKNVGILQLQCFTDFVYLLTNNGKKNQLITISLQYHYEDETTKNAGYGSFLIISLIVVVVFYQIKKYLYNKKAAKLINDDPRYVELQERVAVSSSYGH